MPYTAKELIAIAKAEIGYKGKKTNSQLDSKTANAGGKYTKYARDLAKAGYYNGNKNGFDWCDVFVDWCFYQLCGKDMAKAEQLEYQTGDLGAGCTWSMGYYRNAGRLYKSPKVGDQIFFGSGNSSYHTGVVETVSATKITTIEGNTSGMVARRTYSINDSTIAGYGRPKYDNDTSADSKAESNADTVDVTYRVKAGGKWLPAVINLTDYAGVENKPITDVAIKVSKGTVKYRVHILGGGWLPYVTGYNINDYNNGYAGNGKPIDAIEIIYGGDKKAYYRVSPIGTTGYYSYQTDNNKGGDMDGYAGAIGVKFDKLQIYIK